MCDCASTGKLGEGDVGYMCVRVGRPEKEGAGYVQVCKCRKLGKEDVGCMCVDARKQRKMAGMHVGDSSKARKRGCGVYMHMLRATRLQEDLSN